jgi:hypothetical protein
VIAVSDEHSRIRNLKQKWQEEDAARDTQEERAQQMSLEEEVNETFAPIEDFLTRLGKVLSAAASASVEIDKTWEQLSNRRSRRVARVISSNPPRQLRLEFTIQGMRISYHDKAYLLSGGIKTLISVVTADVEQFLTPHRVP